MEIEGYNKYFSLDKENTDTWKLQYPNVNLTREIKGDKEYAGRFRGESDILLFQLKNHMKFNNLGQLKMTRMFKDGTIVTAWSRFGQDFITVDVTQVSEEEDPVTGTFSCTVTFIDLPEVVPPMRHPHEILSDEVEGTHFIKTYYTYDIAECAPCENGSETVQLEFKFQFTDPSGIEYKENLDNPDNKEEHCIVSEDGGCFAEIIDQGTDSGGTFFRWKAYTEGINQTRSGYGFTRLRASISNIDSGDEVCFAQNVIKVDCCVKDGLLSPEIYWESWERADCTQFVMYGSTKLCKVPDEISMTTLYMYASAGGGYFYAIPQVGGCPDYDWRLSGPGTLLPLKGLVSRYQPVPGGGSDCNETVGIVTTDRCGNSDIIATISDCGNSAPLSISYTSLLMACSGQQSFFAIGGVSPYIWSLSGGGDLSFSGSGATYTAPATNVNCTDNPTITVTDCCGETASVKLAVNCASGESMWYSTFSNCGDCSNLFGDIPPYYYGQVNYTVSKYDCDGTETSFCETNPTCSTYTAFGPSNPTCSDTVCFSATCGGSPCGLSDKRTAPLKAAGCCPINPLTGLPYD